MSRQRTFFHKCHRCIFRGKSAEWKPEVPQQLTIEVDVPIPSVNGTAKKVAKKPAPQKAAGKTSQKSGPKARPRGAAQADA